MTAQNERQAVEMAQAEKILDLRREVEHLTSELEIQSRTRIDAINRAEVEKRSYAAEALRDVANRMSSASPSETFAPGWAAAEISIRVRADDIEAGW